MVRAKIEKIEKNHVLGIQKSNLAARKKIKLSNLVYCIPFGQLLCVSKSPSQLGTDETNQNVPSASYCTPAREDTERLPDQTREHTRKKTGVLHAGTEGG